MAIITLVCGLAVHAADVVVGSVLAVRGEVSAESGGNLQPLATNDPVHRGDTIVSKAGKAKIALDDGSILSIGENARVNITEFDRSPNDGRTRLNLLSGAGQGTDVRRDAPPTTPITWGAKRYADALARATCD